MKNRKNNRKANRNSNSHKASKVSKAKAKLDALGFEVGSNQAIVNKAMSTKRALTVAELAEKTGLNHRRCRYQCRVLVRQKLAKKVQKDEGLAYRLAK
jgi:hypothetical protein